MKTIIDLMGARANVRRFKPEAPPRELLQDLVAAAATALATSGQAPWRFIVVTNRQVIGELAKAALRTLDRIATRVKPELFEPYFQRSAPFSQLASAPSLIVPTYRHIGIVSPYLARPLTRRDAESVAKVEELSGLVSTALALQNLLLAAHARGLGAGVMIEPLLAMPAVVELLSVPPAWHAAALVAVGYPDETTEAPPHPAVGTVMVWLD
ncbi:MAG TPA: nitroreductase family protein [Thermoanaerobaculaceae bacterium]|nr:nitroreductase family protein [Thermoanaerobaculaceae bacterium]